MEEKLSVLSDVLLKYPHCGFPVLNTRNQLIGSITRQTLSVVLEHYHDKVSYILDNLSPCSCDKVSYILDNLSPCSCDKVSYILDNLSPCSCDKVSYILDNLSPCSCDNELHSG